MTATTHAIATNRSQQVKGVPGAGAIALRKALANGSAVRQQVVKVVFDTMPARAQARFPPEAVAKTVAEQKAIPASCPYSEIPLGGERPVSSGQPIHH